MPMNHFERQLFRRIREYKRRREAGSNKLYYVEDEDSYKLCIREDTEGGTTKWLQDKFKLNLYIEITDDEKFLFRREYDWKDVQKNARAAKRGLWADLDPVPPWEWRRGARAPSEYQPEQPRHLRPAVTHLNSTRRIFQQYP